MSTFSIIAESPVTVACLAVTAGLTLQVTAYIQSHILCTSLTISQFVDFYHKPLCFCQYILFENGSTFESTITSPMTRCSVGL